jgi:hypothetical protein
VKLPRTEPGTLSLTVGKEKFKVLDRGAGWGGGWIKGTLARDFGLPFFIIKRMLLAPDFYPSILLNINSNSPRYSNSKVIPRIIRIREQKFFVMLEQYQKLFLYC